ncbi:MAG: HAD hydrolase-like protein [Patescibacteria group bacterium]|jgi:phosphoglycolate phosphatase-like HAD superfamily hydrolase
MGKLIFAFDFDGTVVDGTTLGFEKVKMALMLSGLQSDSEEVDNALRQNYGASLKELLKIMYKAGGGGVNGSCKYSEFRKKFDVLNREMDNNLSVDNSLVKAIDYIPNSQVIKVLITSRKRKCLNQTVKKIGFDLDIFNYIQTADSYEFIKPDGRVFRPLIKMSFREKVSIEDIFYFGDTLEYDYAAVKNSGFPIKFIGIASGVNTVEEFKDAEIPESRIVPSFQEFAGFLQGLVEEIETGVNLAAVI